VKEEILEILYKYGDNLYIDDEIPIKKLENAKIHYPIDELDSDNVLALMDTTAFGSAKTGMAITVKGIYFKNDWTTKSIKDFLSWEFLSKNDVKKGSMFCVLLARKCEFNLSGTDMNRDTLINLLNDISSLFRERVDEDKKVNNAYSQIIVNLIALCIVVDGEVEDSEIEMAYAILDNDELIQKKDLTIEELGNKINEFLLLKQKSETLFKLKVLSISSKLTSLENPLEKENILLILEVMLESVHIGNKENTELFIKKIQESLV